MPDRDDLQLCTIRLPLELHAEIKERAAELDLSMSQAVRRAIRQWLDKEAK
jgi:Arc/MetJ-type ribon-helix-helix transcriptional regulator